MNDQEIRTAALNATIEIVKMKKDEIPEYDSALTYLDSLFTTADFICDYIQSGAHIHPTKNLSPLRKQVSR